MLVAESACHNCVANPLCSLELRCRKKKYTEELEQEKKFYAERNRELEDEMKNLTVMNEELLLQNGQLSQEVEALKSERERLAEKQSDPSPTILPPQLPYEFSEFTNNMDLDWDNFIIIDNFTNLNLQMQIPCNAPCSHNVNLKTINIHQKQHSPLPKCPQHHPVLPKTSPTHPAI